MTTSFVVGFVFDRDLKKVVLIEKARPAWQAGQLNGVGGHVEPGESAEQAMLREAEEEIGLRLTWKKFCEFSVQREGNGHVVCFYSIIDDVYDAIQRTDEVVYVISLSNFPENTLPNIPWLTAMALSFERGEVCRLFEVKELM